MCSVSCTPGGRRTTARRVPATRLAAGARLLPRLACACHDANMWCHGSRIVSRGGQCSSPGRALVPWLGTRAAVAKVSTVNSDSEVWHPSELACALHMMHCLKYQVRRCARPRNPSSRDLLTKCGRQCVEPWLKGGGPWPRPWEPQPRCVCCALPHLTFLTDSVLQVEKITERSGSPRQSFDGGTELWG